MKNLESHISRRKVLASAGVAAGTGLAAGALATINSAAQAGETGMNPDLEQQLQIMLEKQAIAELLMTYCRAVDHLDVPTLRTLFHPGSQHKHGFEGPSSSTDGSDDFIGYATGFLNTFSRTHHQLGNMFIEIDGDVAHSESYFTAFHRRRALEDPMAGEDATETEMDYYVAGRYLDRWEKRDGAWKITHRTGMTDWTRLEEPTTPALDLAPKDVAGQHGPDDYVYHYKSAYAGN